MPCTFRVGGSICGRQPPYDVGFLIVSRLHRPPPGRLGPRKLQDLGARKSEAAGGEELTLVVVKRKGPADLSRGLFRSCK